MTYQSFGNVAFMVKCFMSVYLKANCGRFCTSWMPECATLRLTAVTWTRSPTRCIPQGLTGYQGSLSTHKPDVTSAI